MIIASDTPDPHDEFADLRRVLKRTSTRSRTPIYGSARRASRDDLTRFTRIRLGKRPGTFTGVTLALENTESGSIEVHPNRTLYLPDDLRERNILVVGQSGSGKTQTTIYPAIHADIADTNSSLMIIVRDGIAAGVATQLVNRYRPGAVVENICFGDRQRSTTTWQPFQPAGKQSTILERVQTFISASHTASDRIDSFWDGTSARIIAGLAQRLNDSERPWSPADLYHLLEFPRPQLIHLLKNGQPLPFANTSAAFIESGAPNAETSLSFAQAYCRIFNNPDIAAVTASGEYSHKQLFENPKVVVLEVPLHYQETARPLVNLFVTTLLREATEYAATQPGHRLPHPLNIHFDDFPLLTGKIPELAQQLNLVRSCGVRTLAATHSIGSIEHFFGSEANLVLAGFSTKIFMSHVEPIDAKWASENSGTTTVDVHEVHQTRDPRISRIYRTSNRTKRQVARPLLLPEEVRLAPKHPKLGRASTVFLADEHVFQAWLPPAYKDPLLGPIIQRVQKTTARTRRSKEIPMWTPMLQPTDGQSMPLLYQHKHEEIYNQLKGQLFTAKDTPDDLIYWKQIEKRFHKQYVLVFFTQELLRRKASIGDYRKAMEEAQTTSLEATLAFMDYKRFKNGNGK